MHNNQSDLQACTHPDIHMCVHRHDLINFLSCLIQFLRMEIKYWGPDRYPADWEFSEISTMLWSVFFFWIPGYRHEFGYVVDHFIVTDCLFLSNINSVFFFFSGIWLTANGSRTSNVTLAWMILGTHLVLQMNILEPLITVPCLMVCVFIFIIECLSVRYSLNHVWFIHIIKNVVD